MGGKKKNQAKNEPDASQSIPSNDSQSTEQTQDSNQLGSEEEKKQQQEETTTTKDQADQSAQLNNVQNHPGSQSNQNHQATTQIHTQSQKAPEQEESKQFSHSTVDKSKIKRKDSKFDLQREGQDKQLYRPEFKYDEAKVGTEKLWELMNSYIGSDKRSIQRSIVNHVEYTLARSRFSFDDFGAYQASAFSIRDRLIESWNDTNEYFTTNDSKRVYYLSLEFLLGRLMQNALVNIDVEEPYKDALMDIGYKLENLYEEEVDPALGNGGLGRLAACFLDSMATLEIPNWGYGIRYDYGIFKQGIVDGYQVESPDYWLSHGNPWEIERQDVTYHVRFYGHVKKYNDGGVERGVWEGGDVVVAQAYDTPIPGFNTFNCNNLRLWRSRPCNEFDFKQFNAGDYHGAIGERQKAEYITSVLYPNDSSEGGKELRLKQQYFFCSATIRDIIRRYKKTHSTWNFFHEKNQIQLNDTHPAIASIELLRILIDEEKLPWDQAWGIMYKTFAYTNHTVLPEALEKWSTKLIGNLLPRHLDLIYLINFFFLEKVKQRYPGDNSRVSRMSLIEEGDDKKVRMAFLSIVCSHTVNGVAALHSELLKKTIFKDFDEMFPGKLQNKTNGVTPRRWIHCCNPGLSKLISDTIMEEHTTWLTNLTSLRELSAYSQDGDFIKRFVQVKSDNKLRLQKWVKEHTGIDIPTNALYDVMVKRIHEYKRQFMNILYVIHRYLQIKETPQHERAGKFVPRVVMIGGKAAPGYANAKAIIKLINSVAQKINNDRDVGELLKVVFLPNYCVSAAQIIIPAAELSQHISTAGTEASGTSNMKFIMNGSIIIGTMDGANVEIAEEIGAENMFIFGALVPEVDTFRKQLHDGRRDYIGSRLRKVFDAIRSGTFGDVSTIHGMLYSIENGGDYYCVCLDYYPYLTAQEKVDETYRDYHKWCKMSIEGIAKSGKFSSDRTIQEYCMDIWKVSAVSIPKPTTNPQARVRSYANLTEMQ